MELTIGNLIKILIAVFVIVIVVFGVYSAFNSYIIPYFKGVTFNSSKLILSLI